VALVVPRDDGRALDELLRRGAHRWPVCLECGDHVGRRGHEAGAIARHRRALAQRLEDDRPRAVARLERRDRRLVEPQLGVGLVRGDVEVALRRGFREPLVEVERCKRAGRIVRIVHPDDRGVVRDPVDVGEKAVVA
jgi:hypothetical protein